MRTASGPEPVREPEEIFLVDRVQHLDHRTLDDLVLQRCYAERAAAAIRLWYVMPARRLRPVGSSMNPSVKIGELALENPRRIPAMSRRLHRAPHPALARSRRCEEARH